jgi:hypothetical protein
MVDNLTADQEKIKREAEDLAKKQKEERLKKEAELKKFAAPQKLYYDVKVECMLPATLTYRILAENEMKAAEMIKNLQPNSVHHKLHGRKELKITVYMAGSNMIKWMKRLIG